MGRRGCKVRSRMVGAPRFEAGKPGLDRVANWREGPARVPSAWRSRGCNRGPFRHLAEWLAECSPVGRWNNIWAIPHFCGEVTNDLPIPRLDGGLVRRTGRRGLGARFVGHGGVDCHQGGTVRHWDALPGSCPREGAATAARWPCYLRVRLIPTSYGKKATGPIGPVTP